MKLNPDCVRDILLVVEECESVIFPNNYPKLNKYTYDEIMYHVKQCDNADLFNCCRKYVDGGYGILDLSPKGHDFLAKVRNDTIWTKFKSHISSIGIGSVLSLVEHGIQEIF